MGVKVGMVRAMKILRSGTFWVVAAVVVIAVVVATAFWGRMLAQPGPLATEKTVIIAPGSGLIRITSMLEQENIIADDTAFKYAVWLMGLEGSLQAGEYAFTPGVSMREVINTLATGAVMGRELTFPEGWRTSEMLARIQAADGLTDDVPQNVPEGALFPDTYYYTHGMKAGKLVYMMRQRMEEELQRAWEMRTHDVLANQQQLLTLASIVEKEAATPDEHAKIAGVFLNRLRQDMRLESDPTVIYGATDYDGDITTQHLREDQPYNTYVHKGLPPTPIANPGRAALEGVAQPAAHDYIFFVAAPGRTAHAFSKTYAEHARNVDKYLKWLQEQDF